jgi:hypothetical protein
VPNAPWGYGPDAADEKRVGVSLDRDRVAFHARQCDLDQDRILGHDHVDGWRKLVIADLLARERSIDRPDLIVHRMNELRLHTHHLSRRVEARRGPSRCCTLARNTGRSVPSATSVRAHSD